MIDQYKPAGKTEALPQAKCLLCGEQIQFGFKPGDGGTLPYWHHPNAKNEPHVGVAVADKDAPPPSKDPTLPEIQAEVARIERQFLELKQEYEKRFVVWQDQIRSELKRIEREIGDAQTGEHQVPYFAALGAPTHVPTKHDSEIFPDDGVEPLSAPIAQAFLCKACGTPIRRYCDSWVHTDPIAAVTNEKPHDAVAP